MSSMAAFNPAISGSVPSSVPSMPNPVLLPQSSAVNFQFILNTPTNYAGDVSRNMLNPNITQLEPHITTKLQPSTATTQVNMPHVSTASMTSTATPAGMAALPVSTTFTTPYPTNYNNLLQQQPLQQLSRPANTASTLSSSPLNTATLSNKGSSQAADQSATSNAALSSQTTSLQAASLQATTATAQQKLEEAYQKAVIDRAMAEASRVMAEESRNNYLNLAKTLNNTQAQGNQPQQSVSASSQQAQAQTSLPTTPAPWQQPQTQQQPLQQGNGLTVINNLPSPQQQPSQQQQLQQQQPWALLPEQAVSQQPNAQAFQQPQMPLNMATFQPGQLSQLPQQQPNQQQQQWLPQQQAMQQPQQAFAQPSQQMMFPLQQQGFALQQQPASFMPQQQAFILPDQQQALYSQQAPYGYNALGYNPYAPYSADPQQLWLQQQQAMQQQALMQQQMQQQAMQQQQLQQQLQQQPQEFSLLNLPPEQLRALIQSPNPDEAYKAMEAAAMRNMADPQTIELLKAKASENIANLEEKTKADPSIQPDAYKRAKAGALWGLAALKDDAAVTLATDWVKDKNADPKLRLAAVKALRVFQNPEDSRIAGVIKGYEKDPVLADEIAKLKNKEPILGTTTTGAATASSTPHMASAPSFAAEGDDEG